MNLNDDEIKEFTVLCLKCFERYDTNGNGVIEISELKPLLMDVAKESGTDLPTDDDVKGVFDDTDLDKNKVITKDEFVELYKVIYIMKKKIYNNQ
jgi:Ca2+-binding EF-hand superfamily protein